jgi:DNA gyrase subunit A
MPARSTADQGGPAADPQDLRRPRRTGLVADEGEINIEDLIADQGCVITISHGGYIKRVPVSTYRQQRRGGKGVSGMNTKDEDYVEHVFMASTHDVILFFTEQGRMYAKKVYEIPEGGRASRGKAIVNLLAVTSDEKVAAMIRIRVFSEEQHIVMATERGIVKKTNLREYENVRASGIIAITIEEGDRLIGARLTEGQNEVILITRDGMSIRFDENQLRDQGAPPTASRAFRWTRTTAWRAWRWSSRARRCWS